MVLNVIYVYIYLEMFFQKHYLNDILIFFFSIRKLLFCWYFVEFLIIEYLKGKVIFVVTRHRLSLILLIINQRFVHAFWKIDISVFAFI